MKHTYTNATCPEAPCFGLKYGNAAGLKTSSMREAFVDV